MTQFLADYGLRWVGNDGQREGKFDDKAINKELNHKAPQYRNNLPKEIDTEVLTRRIEELNFIAEKQKVVKNRDGLHQFIKVAEVNIFFFKNGLIIKGFPFYPYYSKEAQVPPICLKLSIECSFWYLGWLLPIWFETKIPWWSSFKACRSHRRYLHWSNKSRNS